MFQLRAMIDACPGKPIAVGGLVRLLRDKDQATLTRLHEICDMHPCRLHILGLNWLKAINELKDKIHSADTSKWLDAARYGHLLFIHEKTGKLHQAPAKVLGHGDLSREARLLRSAKAMNDYLNPDALTSLIYQELTA